MSLKHLRQSAAQAGFLIKTGGVARWWQHLLQNIIMFDLKYKTDTARWLDASEFPADIPNVKHIRRYRATLQSELEDSFDAAIGIMAQHNIQEQDITFTDLGCGKGKPGIYAALNHNFGRNVGVDFHPGLLDIFADNIEAAKRHVNAVQGARLDEIERVHSDVVAHTDYGDANIAFMYFPFDRKITESVGQRLREASGKSLIIYNYPEHEAALLEQGWKEVWRKDNPNPDQRTAIFAYGI